MRTLRPVGTLALTLSVVCVPSAGCNRRVFEKIEPSCNTTLFADIEVPVARAADILIVVDNSGSMLEEQEELARNFVNPLCPIDLSAPIPDAYKNPSPALYAPGGELENCGFIQLIAAFDNDFRVGVITTDVGVGDNRFDDAPDGWGSRPQRGCLQPDGPPGTDVNKLIARADLEDADPNNDDLAERFSRTLQNVQVFGSVAERGLDAATLFLDPGAERAPGCAGDLTQFRRPDEQLVVLFLTDEEDCSHAYGSSAFGEEVAQELELAGTSCDSAADCGGAPMSCQAGVCVASYAVSAASARCYAEIDDLPSPDVFASRILAEDPRAKIAVIGGVSVQDGSASRCTQVNGDVVDTCFASRGFSNRTEDGLVCGATVDRTYLAGTEEEKQAAMERIAQGRSCELSSDGATAFACELACCQADPGGRYVDFAAAFSAEDGQSNAFLDSICKESYRDTMLKLAAFIASVDIVKLAAPPADEDLIVVSITRADDGDTSRVLQIDAADCLNADGFYYDPEQVALVFCGDARLGPGDDLEVRAPGEAREVDGCALPE
jgi:hypothetical protein